MQKGHQIFDEAESAPPEKIPATPMTGEATKGGNILVLKTLMRVQA